MIQNVSNIRKILKDIIKYIIINMRRTSGCVQRSGRSYAMYIQGNSVTTRSLVNQHICCIIFREASSGPVFGNEIEKKRFLDILLDARQSLDAEVYAYCILDRKGYILAGVRQKSELKAAADSMKSAFESCYHETYPREKACICCEMQWLGKLTWGEITEACIRIQQLPVEHLRVEKAEDYWWSSLKEYLLRYRSGIMQPELLLGILDPDRRRAVRKMKTRQEAWRLKEGKDSNYKNVSGAIL